MVPAKSVSYPVFFLASACLLIPTSVSGQVQGRVAFPAGQAERVVVRVIPDSGAPPSTLVTQTDGSFEVPVSVGEASFEVHRPGFVAVRSDTDRVTGDIRLEAPSRPVAYPSAVAGTMACVAQPAGVGQDRLATALEQAQTGLRLASWSESSEAVLSDVTVHVRDLRPDARQVAVERAPRVERGASRITNATDPAFLRDSGYMVEDTGDDGLQFYGPDPSTILSDEFMASHCWRLRSDGGEALIGLGFEPVEGRTQPDVAGVLWMEAASSNLLALEFTYRNLDFGVDLSQAGGRTLFARLPDGTVTPVENWMRLPVLQVQRVDNQEDQWVLSGLHEQGVRVHRVISGDEAWSLSPGSATLRGTIRDASGRTALDGARVTLGGTEYEAFTGVDGAFEFTGLLEGVYRLTFEHPEVPETDVGTDVVSVDLRLGQVSSVELRAPSLDDIALDLCQAGRGGRGTVVLTGQVRDSITEQPLSGVGLSIRYRDPRQEGTPYHEARISTGAGGEYVYCDAPVGETVRIKALTPGYAERDTSVVVYGSTVRTDLTVPLSTDIGPGGVFGTVLDWMSGDPVESVEVVIAETGLTTTTNRNGFFQFEAVPSGLHMLEFNRLGYQDRELVVRLTGGGAYQLSVDLTVDAIPIEGITVTAVPRRLFADMVDLQHRMELGFGQFVTREEIETRGGNVGTLLQSIGGAELVNTPDSRTGELYAVFRNASRLNIQVIQVEGGNDDAQGGQLRTMIEQCFPAVFVDGHRFSRPRAGGIGHDPVDLSGFLAAELEAIEIYKGAGTVPAEFGGGNAACGAIVLWTQRGLPVSYSQGGRGG